MSPPSVPNLFAVFEESAPESGVKTPTDRRNGLLPAPSLASSVDEWPVGSRNEDRACDFVKRSEERRVGKEC